MRFDLGAASQFPHPAFYTNLGPFHFFFFFFFSCSQLANKLDPEGRYFFLNAVANQLRYPNQHTHYFSCVLLYLFAEAQSEMVQEQITRILLERLIVHRPHPVRLCSGFVRQAANNS